MSDELSQEEKAVLNLYQRIQALPTPISLYDGLLQEQVDAGEEPNAKDAMDQVPGILESTVYKMQAAVQGVGEENKEEIRYGEEGTPMGTSLNKNLVIVNGEERLTLPMVAIDTMRFEYGLEYRGSIHSGRVDVEKLERILTT